MDSWICCTRKPPSCLPKKFTLQPPLLSGMGEEVEQYQQGGDRYKWFGWVAWSSIGRLFFPHYHWLDGGAQKGSIIKGRKRTWSSDIRKSPIVFMFVTAYLVTVQMSYAAARGRARINKSSFQKEGLLRQFCAYQVRDIGEKRPEVGVREHCNRTCGELVSEGKVKTFSSISLLGAR